MADDDTGGTLHPFPGLRIPGAVADDPPPASGGFPVLAPVAALAPPASLSVADAPDLSGGAAAGTTTAHRDPGLSGDSQSSGSGVAAMSVVMMAGITVAAMRGAYHAAAYLKARHDHHRAIADQQGVAADKSGLELEKARIGVDAARQKSRIQSGPEFGKSSRNSSGSGGRSNSSKNSTPASLRSGGGPNRPGGGGGKTPNKGPGGGSGGRSGGGGTPGQSRLSPSRKKPLDGSGGKTPANRNSSGSGGGSGGVRNGSGNSKTDRGPSLRSAARQRAADRVRNGPAPKNGPSPKSGGGRGGTPGSGSGGPSGKKTGSGGPGATPGSGSKSPKSPKPGTKGSGGTPGTGSGSKGSGSKSGSSGSGTGRTTLPQAIAKESERRLNKRRKRLQPVIARPRTGKKPKKGGKATAAGTAPTTPKVSLTKKPKTPAPPKVSLTKKPRPPKVSLTKKPGTRGSGSAGPAGAGTPGAAKPKVNLRKKPRVNLKKKPGAKGSGKKAGPAGPAAGPTGPGPGTGTGAPKGKRKGWRWSGRKDPNKGRGARERWERTNARRGTASGPAGPGGGFGPPPGWGHTVDTTVTLERLDGGPGAQERRHKSTTTSRVALPAGTKGAPVAAPVVPMPRKAPNTQYADSDLTIYDVIDSDADMAEEIMAGADNAREAAEGCEKLTTRLEYLHAKVMDLKVPGVLEGWVLLLAEKAMNVKARAEAVAEKIPAASEAIRVAGENAAERHREVADVTRDQGHAAPAEADYHNE
ncbi:hypothetical protein ACIREO_38940 [Streptomyces sp. NPDC102441]|uniref:hypothetical protein n=1 Tax=Streptomyces sp. NPDC102441 TaxID=3366176 RepID=UPI00382B3488